MNIVKKCRYGLMVFNQSDVYQGKSFEQYGEYSEAEVKVFGSLVKNDDTVVDIGANIGSHTVPLSRLVGEKGTVIAFEPERNAFYTLCGNIACNNLHNVFCFQQALGSHTGTIDVPEVDVRTTTNFGAIELGKDYKNVSHYPVTMNTLDNIRLSRIDFIKIDVEGMELDVLLGAKLKIATHRPYLYVENDREEKSADLIEYIAGLNYKVYQHVAFFFNQDNYYEEKNDVFGTLASLNILCIPQEKEIPAIVQELGLTLVS